MSHIKNIIEFKKLKLVWQSQNDPNHFRYVVAELVQAQNGQVLLNYLRDTEDFTKAQNYGFTGYPAFNLDKEVHSQGVLDAFQRRLPPRTRSDFDKYLEMFCLLPGAQISDFSLLGYSGAKLPGDEFSITPSFEEISQSCEFLMEVAGFRHETEIPIDQIQLNSAVIFQPEPNNEFDSNAIKILQDGKKIGYVTRSLLSQVHIWLNENRVYRARIERKNGQPSKPILYLFIEIKEKILMKRHI